MHTVKIKLNRDATQENQDKWVFHGVDKTGEGVYKYNCVGIVFIESSATVYSDQNLLSVAFIAKTILKKFGGYYTCTKKLVQYMPPSSFNGVE